MTERTHTGGGAGWSLATRKGLRRRIRRLLADLDRGRCTMVGRKWKPKHSYRAIAGALGVDHTTIMDDVKRSTGGESPVALPENIVGLDGKVRAAGVVRCGVPELVEGRGSR